MKTYFSEAAAAAVDLAGRPESVTRTWLWLRSRTAVMVAVQRCPLFACTVMGVPTSSAGSVDVSPR